MFLFLLDLFFINIIIIVIIISFKLQNLIWDLFFFFSLKTNISYEKSQLFLLKCLFIRKTKNPNFSHVIFFPSLTSLNKYLIEKSQLFPLGMFVHIYKKNLNFLYKMFVCKEKKIPDHMFEILIIMILPIWIVKGS